MMASCVLFIVNDGFWSYPGFVAVEVIVLSSCVALLLIIDVISAIKCKTVGKKQTLKAIKVAASASVCQIPSDEDQDFKSEGSRARRENIAISRPRGGDDYGGDESSEYDEASVTELNKVRNSQRGPRSKRQDSEASYNSRIS